MGKDMILRKVKVVALNGSTPDFTIGNTYNGIVQFDCFEACSDNTGKKNYLFNGEYEVLPLDNQEVRFGDFLVRVSYTPVESTYMHRYHVECVDMRKLIVVFKESNVTDMNYEYPIDDAVALIKRYFMERFGVDIFSMPKTGWL